MVKVNDTQIVELFEQAVADYIGAKYCVAISSQTNAVFLCLKMLQHLGRLKEGTVINVPRQTYMSIPMMVLNCNMKIAWTDEHWSGAYRLSPTQIYDSAVRFTKGCYVKGSLYCVSFQYRKNPPIGRGGACLTDDKEYANLLRKMRFNGRSPVPQAEDVYKIMGYNMYFLPEMAARGMTLLTMLPEKNKDIASWQDYPDVSKQFSEEIL